MCVPPSSLSNGYIYPYPNISSRVIIVCTGSDRIYYNISNCNPNGIWQPNPDNVCDADEMSQGKLYYNIMHMETLNTKIMDIRYILHMYTLSVEL